MPDESILREKAREVIRNGKLSDRRLQLRVTRGLRLASR
jgi:hypothetical protein